MIRRTFAALIAAVALTSCATGETKPQVTKVRIDGRPSAVVAADARIWVADDRNHQVQVVDPRTRKVVRKIKVKRNPVGLAAGGGRVWVAHASGVLVSIDTETNETDELDLGGSLTGVAYGLGRVWVTDLERNQLIGVAPSFNGRPDKIGVREGAVRVAVHRGAIWVSGTEATVSEVDPSTEEIRVHDVGLGPIGVASLGDDVWVANSDDDTVQRVGEEGFVPVGDAPIALADAGGSIWVANLEGESLTRIEGDEAAAQVDLGFRPRGVARYAGAVWVAGTNPNTLARVEP